jgi:hypothetical protein
VAVKIDTLVTVPPHLAIAAGLGRKAILLINGEFRAETTRCSKCDNLLHDGSVRLDFMTDDVNEAEEMRIRTLASDCVAEIRNSNESGWVSVRGGGWQTRRLEGPLACVFLGPDSSQVGGVLKKRVQPSEQMAGHALLNISVHRSMSAEEVALPVPDPGVVRVGPAHDTLNHVAHRPLSTLPVRSFFEHQPHTLSRLEAATRPYHRPESFIVRFWLRKSV